MFPHCWQSIFNFRDTALWSDCSSFLNSCSLSFESFEHMYTNAFSIKAIPIGWTFQCITHSNEKQNDGRPDTITGVFYQCWEEVGCGLVFKSIYPAVCLIQDLCPNLTMDREQGTFHRSQSLNGFSDNRWSKTVVSPIAQYTSRWMSLAFQQQCTAIFKTGKTFFPDNS